MIFIVVVILQRSFPQTGPRSFRPYNGLIQDYIQRKLPFVLGQRQSLDGSDHRAGYRPAHTESPYCHTFRLRIRATFIPWRIQGAWCSQVRALLEGAAAGEQSEDEIHWTDGLLSQFSIAQSCLSTKKSLSCRLRQTIRLTDLSVNVGLVSLYTSCTGFFSGKLRKQQFTWMPCEIAAATPTPNVRSHRQQVVCSGY